MISFSLFIDLLTTIGKVRAASIDTTVRSFALEDSRVEERRALYLSTGCVRPG